MSFDGLKHILVLIAVACLCVSVQAQEVSSIKRGEVVDAPAPSTAPTSTERGNLIVHLNTHSSIGDTEF